jgi:putative MATE family efflux protein
MVDTPDTTETTTQAGTTRNRDWTQGNIFKNLLSIAWPIIISNSLNNIGPTIDLIWVGKLGAASVAGVGVAGILVQLLDAFKMGLDMGTRALIARAVGAGDSQRANHVALQGYVVTIGFAAIVGTLGAIFATHIMRLFGLEPDVVAQGAPYLRIQFIGILTMGIVRQNEGTMISSGDTINPMRVSIIYRLFHIALCPFLVFGWWIFPRLGTSGAAWTEIISACLGATVGLWFLLTGHTRLKLHFRGFHPDIGIIWRVIKIGVPASVTNIQRSFGQLALTSFVMPFGTIAIAAHTLTQKVDQFLNIAGSGLGQAAGVLAGQNLGANQPERSEKTMWYSVLFCTGIMVIGSIVILLWGRNIVALFNSEPALVAMGNTFLRIQIISYMVFGFAVVMQQCLNGVGDTLPVMLVVLVSIFVVQIPLAFFLTRYTGLGVYGARWAMVAGTLVTASSYFAYFKLGRWKRRKL